MFKCFVGSRFVPRKIPNNVATLSKYVQDICHFYFCVRMFRSLFSSFVYSQAPDKKSRTQPWYRRPAFLAIQRSLRWNAYQNNYYFMECFSYFHVYTVQFFQHGKAEKAMSFVVFIWSKKSDTYSSISQLFRSMPHWGISVREANPNLAFNRAEVFVVILGLCWEHWQKHCHYTLS